MACRTSRAKRDLQRIVRTPAGDVIFDPSGRAAGRGAYVCVDGDCLAKAIKKGALSRALATQLPPAFLANVQLGDDITLTPQGGPRGQE